MKKFAFFLLISLSVLGCTSPTGSTGPSFQLSYATGLVDSALDGRMLLLIAKGEESEPRFQINDGPSTGLVYGADVSGLAAGKAVLVDADTFGYPIQSLADLPAGEYYVQGLLHRYETFHLSTGYTVKLPMDYNEGQQWNRSPGNLYSKSQKIEVKAGQNQTFDIVLDQIIPPIDSPT
ncbi:MAG: hypothetical protein AAF804_17390, partial [Bacteroidota bacterium]